jgi:uncharacterized protein
MTTTLCFYHSADLDGYCSAAIVKHFIPDVELYGINYNQPVPWDKVKNRPVVMVDFSLPMDDMKRLQHEAKSLVWIDHHKTAIDAAYQEEFGCDGYAQVGTGACELCWKWFTSRCYVANCIVREDVPYFIRLLADYDVWKHDDPRVLAFQYGMRLEATGPEAPIWKDLFDCVWDRGEKIREGVTTIGEHILRYEKQQNERYVKSSFATELDGHPAIACNKGQTNSKLFDSVPDLEKYDLMITFSLNRAGKWLISLYSAKPDVDCGAIAKKYGGGGHAGAGGCQCDTLPFKLPSQQ